MNKYPDGGHAFPSSTCGDWQDGMTLRDWFAGMAVGHMYQDRIRRGGEDSPYDDAAYRAYALADALLAERLKGPDDE